MRAPLKTKFKARTGWVEKRETGEPLGLEPWLPPAYDDFDMAALQALRRGEADALQQQRVLAWLLYASGKEQWGYVPGDQSARDVWHGRQFLGFQLVKILKAKLNTEKDRENHGG